MQQTSFSKLKGTRIGIDVSDETFRIVSVDRTSIRFETCNPHASPELERALAAGNVCTAGSHLGTALAVPLETPALSANKLHKILPSLLDVQLPLPVSECATAFVHYKTACMAYTIRKTDLQNLIGQLAAQGCNPARIVPSTHAAWTLSQTEHPPADSDEARALFIATPKQTMLLTGHGEILERQNVFTTTEEEPLRRLKLTFGGLPEQLICIVAGSAHATINTSLTPAAHPSALTITTAQSPDFFLARALAYDGGFSGTAVDADLRQTSFPHAATTRRQQRPAVILSAALTACAIILAAVALTRTSTASKIEAQTRTTLQNRLDTLAGYPIRTQGERALQDARAAFPLTLDEAIQHYMDNRIPNKMAIVATLCKQHNILLQHLSISAEGLKASASAKTENAVDRFVQALQTAGITTALTEPAKSADNAGVTFFILPTQP